MKTLKLYGISTSSKIILTEIYQLVKGHSDILSAIAFHLCFSYKLQFSAQYVLKSKFIDLQQSKE
jgi:hypothetical protein